MCFSLRRTLEQIINSNGKCGLVTPVLEKRDGNVKYQWRDQVTGTLHFTAQSFIAYTALWSIDMKGFPAHTELRTRKCTTQLLHITQQPSINNHGSYHVVRHLEDCVTIVTIATGPVSRHFRWAKNGSELQTMF